jgi:hypothetical protein
VARSSQFFRDERAGVQCCLSLNRVLQIISPEQRTMKEKVVPGSICQGRDRSVPLQTYPLPPYLFFEMLQIYSISGIV